MAWSIKEEGFQLRILMPEDVSERYLGWLNDQTSSSQMISSPPPDLVTLKAYVAEKQGRQDCLFLGIFSAADNTHLGNIKFEPIDLRDRSSNFGLLIGSEARGRGIAFRACKAAFEYVFLNLKLRLIRLSVFENNIKAVALYQRLGFVQTGLRTHLHQGLSRNVIDMQLGAANFFAQITGSRVKD